MTRPWVPNLPFAAVGVTLFLLLLLITLDPSTGLPAPMNRQAGISENVYITLQNDTYGVEQRVCSIDSLTYEDGDSIPTSSPCEHCICRPPGFACTIISCEYRPGCKAVKRSNQCCPEFLCECEKDGKIYQNGEKILDNNNPCEVCYCQGGEVICAVIDCYWRSDCQPRYIENRCCPLYDHCPQPSIQMLGPLHKPSTSPATTSTTFSWTSPTTTTTQSTTTSTTTTTTTTEAPVLVSEEPNVILLHQPDPEQEEAVEAAVPEQVPVVIPEDQIIEKGGHHEEENEIVNEVVAPVQPQVFAHPEPDSVQEEKPLSVHTLVEALPEETPAPASEEPIVEVEPVPEDVPAVIISPSTTPESSSEAIPESILYSNKNEIPTSEADAPQILPLTQEVVDVEASVPVEEENQVVTTTSTEASIPTTTRLPSEPEIEEEVEQVGINNIIIKSVLEDISPAQPVTNEISETTTALPSQGSDEEVPVTTTQISPEVPLVESFEIEEPSESLVPSKVEIETTTLGEISFTTTESQSIHEKVEEEIVGHEEVVEVEVTTQQPIIETTEGAVNPTSPPLEHISSASTPEITTEASQGPSEEATTQVIEPQEKEQVVNFKEDSQEEEEQSQDISSQTESAQEKFTTSLPVQKDEEEEEVAQVTTTEAPLEAAIVQKEEIEVAEEEEKVAATTVPTQILADEPVENLEASEVLVSEKETEENIEFASTTVQSIPSVEVREDEVVVEEVEGKDSQTTISPQALQKEVEQDDKFRMDLNLDEEEEEEHTHDDPKNNEVVFEAGHAIEATTIDQLRTLDEEDGAETLTEKTLASYHDEVKFVEESNPTTGSPISPRDDLEDEDTSTPIVRVEEDAIPESETVSITTTEAPLINSTISTTTLSPPSPPPLRDELNELASPIVISEDMEGRFRDGLGSDLPHGPEALHTEPSPLWLWRTFKRPRIQVIPRRSRLGPGWKHTVETKLKKKPSGIRDKKRGPVYKHKKMPTIL